MRTPRPSVNRREMLRGRGRRPRPAVSGGDSRGVGAAETAGSSDLLKARREAMGSYFEVRIPARTPGAVALLTRALDLIDELEAQMTVYRDDSELSRLNASAHLGPVVVEDDLFGVIARGVALWEETGGAYDLTAGALSIAWGFMRGPKRVPEDRELADARARTGSHHLSLDPERRTVAFDRPGVVINLGSIGKGHAIDRVAGLLRDYWWPTPGLIHGGQSSLYALGSPPDRFGGRWEVALQNPFDASTPLGVIRLRNRGLGTSGSAYQRFEANGRLYGHIIDPRTGVPPADGPASVTVLAPTAAEADALSTAFTLIGPDAAAAYIAAHPGIGAVFVHEGPADRSPRMRVLGLTDSDFATDLTRETTRWS